MAMEIFKLMGTVAINKDKALQDIKAIQDQAKRASTEMGGSFTKFSGYVEQHSAQIKKAGKMMTIFGGIATAVFAVAVKGAADFETQLANVSTMLDASAMTILPEYRRGLQSLSVEFGESTQTLSKGLYDILSASIPPSEALGVLEISAKAAAAGITDTGVAADAITTILNSYGFSADQAGVVSDKLFAIVKEGKTTFAELAPSIGKCAATASMAGLSFDDLGACIATMTRAGIRTEETMTAINGVLIAFLKPTDEAIVAAGKFGLELNTTTLQTFGLTGVMEKLTDATAEQLAAIFPNIRGLKGMAAALGDAEGYARSYALMLESAGLTQEAFAKQSDTLNFKLDQLKEMFNVIKVTIGTALIPTVEDITKKIMGALVKVKEWTEANKPLTESLVKWAAGISGVMLVLGPLFMMLPGIIAAWPAIAAGATAASGAFSALAVSLGLTVAQLGFAIIGFGLLYLEIRKAWDEIKEGPSWKEIGEMAKASAEAQTTALEKLQKAYNLTNEELQYFIDNHEMMPSVMARVRNEARLLKEEKYGLATALGSVNELMENTVGIGAALVKSLEDQDSAVAKLIIRGEELSEQQEEYMALRQRMSDIDKTATQRKIDDLDRECLALLTNMETNLMTMEQIDEYRQVMLRHIIEESSERVEHLRNMEQIENKLFEMTHTQTEVSLKDLEKKREAYIEAAKQAMLSAEKEEEAIIKIQEVYEREKASILELAIARSEKEIASLDKAIELRKEQGELIDELVAKRKAEIENLNGLKEAYSGTAVAAEKLAAAEAKKKVFKVVDAEGKTIGIRSQHQLSQAEAAAGVTLVPMAKGGLVQTFMDAIKHLAAGGGIGTDTVPIMGTPGEYVIKKSMVDFIRRTGMVTGGLVEAIRKGMPTPSPEFAGGGMVGRWTQGQPEAAGKVAWGASIRFAKESIVINAKTLDDDTINQAGDKIMRVVTEKAKAVGLKWGTS